MTLQILLLLSACKRGIQDPGELPVSVPALPESVLRDRSGCWEDGPCIDAGASRRLIWTGAELCLPGQRFGSEPGQAWIGGSDATVASWSDTEVCLSGDSASLDDGLVQLVSSTGRRSNRVGFLTSPRDVQFEIPDPMVVGDVVRITGENLGATSRGGPFHLLGTAGLVEATSLTAGTQSFDYDGKGFGTVSSAPVLVHPRLDVGCVAAANVRCEVGGLGFSAAGGTPADIAAVGHSVTVGGQAATLTAVRPTGLELQWPTGLAAGTHSLVYTGPGGVTASIEVELLSDQPWRLGTDDPDAVYFDEALARPTVVDDAAWLHLWSRQFSPDAGGRPFPGPLSHTLARVPLDTTGPDRLPFGLAGLDNAVFTLDELSDGARIVVVGDDVLAVAADGLWRLTTLSDPTAVGREFVASGSPGDPLGYWLADVRVVDGDLLVASSHRYSNTTTITRYAHSGGIWTGSTVGTLDRAPGVAAGGIYNPGTFLTESGVYSLPTGNNTDVVDPDVYFTPLDRSTDPWTLGVTTDIQGIDVSQGSAVLSAWAETDALTFTVWTAAGVYLFRHTPTGQDPFELLSGLPGLDAPLPAFGGSPIADIARLDDGTLVLLLVDRTVQPHELHLATRRPAGSWTVGPGFGALLSAERGETCEGPSSFSSCPTLGLYGCAPAACPLQPDTLRRRPGHTLLSAAMAVDGNKAAVTWVTQDTTAPGRGYPSGLSEAFLMAVPLP